MLRRIFSCFRFEMRVIPDHMLFTASPVHRNIAPVTADDQPPPSLPFTSSGSSSELNFHPIDDVLTGIEEALPRTDSLDLQPDQIASGYVIQAKQEEFEQGIFNKKSPKALSGELTVIPYELNQLKSGLTKNEIKKERIIRKQKAFKTSFSEYNVSDNPLYTGEENRKSRDFYFQANPLYKR